MLESLCGMKFAVESARIMKSVKMKKVISIVAVAALGCSVALAQPEGFQMGERGERGQRGQRPEGEQLQSDLDAQYSPRFNYLKIEDIDALAQQRTDEMKSMVGLDDKTYKKVLGWMKKDIKFRKKIQKLENPDGDTEEEEEGPGDGPMGGGPGGMGGPGGGPGGMGGGPMGGGPGGMGGGPMGGGFRGGSSSAGNGLMVVDDYYVEDTEKQLKRILGDDKYEAYRSARPAETPYTTRSTSSRGGWGGMGGGMMGGPGGPM